MSFIPFEGEVSYGTRTHLWCEMEDGSIGVSDDCEGIHATVFGEFAWDTPNRGYYWEEQGVVSIHASTMSPALVRKLAKAFPTAIYSMDGNNTRWA